MNIFIKYRTNRQLHIFGPDTGDKIYNLHYSHTIKMDSYTASHNMYIVSENITHPEGQFCKSVS